MADLTKRKKRSKLRAILLAPILVPVFAVGWCLYCIGQKPKPTKQKQAPITPEKDNWELTVNLPEEEILAN